MRLVRLAHSTSGACSTLLWSTESLPVMTLLHDGVADGHGVGGVGDARCCRAGWGSARPPSGICRAIPRLRGRLTRAVQRRATDCPLGPGPQVVTPPTSCARAGGLPAVESSTDLVWWMCLGERPVEQTPLLPHSSHAITMASGAVEALAVERRVEVFTRLGSALNHRSPSVMSLLNTEGHPSTLVARSAKKNTLRTTSFRREAVNESTSRPPASSPRANRLWVCALRRAS